MAAPESEPPTNARYVTLGYLGGLTLILYLDRMCIGKAAPFIQDELGLVDWQMGCVHAAFMLAYGLFEVVTGHWGDRFGSHRVLIRVVVWWSIFTALTGVVGGFVTLLVVRFLFGAGEAGALPNASRVIDRWFPESTRGRVRGFVNTPALVGGMAAPLLTAYLIEAIGWRWVFAVFGSVGVVWALLFSRWFHDAHAEHPSVNAAGRELIGPPPAVAHAGHLPLRPIPGSRNVWLLSGVLASGSCCVNLLFAWYPTYLERVRGVSNVESGWWNSFIMFGGAAGCLAGGWFADVARRRVHNPPVGVPRGGRAGVRAGRVGDGTGFRRVRRRVEERVPGGRVFRHPLSRRVVVGGEQRDERAAHGRGVRGDQLVRGAGGRGGAGRIRIGPARAMGRRGPRVGGAACGWFRVLAFGRCS
jgi:MFS family permease